MEELLRQLLDWVALNPGWAYAVVFLIAMGESLAVIGVVVPGILSLIGTGALVATGAIAFWPAFAAATLGAIVGDGLSYSLGRHFERHIREMWPFCRYPEQLQHGVSFFERYGGWSVAFARFAGPGRAVVPLVAGMLRMDPGRFYFANITSAIAQTLILFLPGMLFGASLKLAAEAALRLSVLALLILASLWLVMALAHRGYALLSPHASTWLVRCLRWADLHPAMGRVAHALADRDRPDARALAGLAFLLVLAAALLGVMGGATLLGVPEIGVNRSLMNFAQGLRSPPGDGLMVAIAALGQPLTLLPMVAAVFLALRWRGRTRHAWYWLAAAAFALIATPLLGPLLQVPRPDLGLTLTPPWSFPSGPVLLATCVYGFLAVSLSRALRRPARWIPFALASALVGALAWSRLYLGAEWFTDTLASLALGVAWVATLGLAFHRHARPDRRPWLLAGVAAAGLIAGLTTQTWLCRDDDLARYTPAPRIEILTRADWLAGAWRQLPARRAALRTQDQHQLSIQLAGDPKELAQALGLRGWAPAETLDWGNALRLLSPSVPLPELPLIPQVIDGRQEALTLVQDGPEGGRRALRLWPTRFRLAEGPPLWVGYVSGLHRESIMDLLAFTATDPAGPGLPQGVQADLQAAAAGLPEGSSILLVPPSGDL